MFECWPAVGRVDRRGAIPLILGWLSRRGGDTTGLLLVTVPSPSVTGAATGDAPAGGERCAEPAPAWTGVVTGPSAGGGADSGQSLPPPKQ